MEFNVILQLCFSMNTKKYGNVLGFDVVIKLLLGLVQCNLFILFYLYHLKMIIEWTFLVLVGDLLKFTRN